MRNRPAVAASSISSESKETLAARVRSEYHEMPGLRLTLAQASRLWQLDTETCEAVLEYLVREGFLIRTPDDAFIALAPGDPRRASPARKRLHRTA